MKFEKKINMKIVMNKFNKATYRRGGGRFILQSI